MTLNEIKKAIEAPVKTNVMENLSERGGLCPMHIFIDSVELSPADTWLDDDGEEDDGMSPEEPDVLQVYGRIIYPYDRKMEDQQFSTFVQYDAELDEYCSSCFQTYIFNEPSIEKLIYEYCREKNQK